MSITAVVIALCVAIIAATVAPAVANEHPTGMSADQALAKLKVGNDRYMQSLTNPGDMSIAKRESLYEGQKPYAVVLACSDSRVVPEDIFSAGLGEIFVIRVAGNVIGDHELGSIEYATGHLGTNLVVVMGHEKCGAVGAALDGHAEGYIKTLTDSIKAGIGGEKDPKRASIANADYVASEVRRRLELPLDGKVKVISAYYNLHGEVDFHD